MEQQITHTTKTFGGEMASIGGVGGFTSVAPTIRVTFSDDATCLIVTIRRGRVEAGGYHKGKSFDLPHRDGDLEAVANIWTKAITARLQSTRLQDKLRNWNVDKSRLAASA